jgi:phage host-nuclease inhibitor protein Gam
MARQKVIAEPVYRSWDEVDQCLREIDEIDGRVSVQEAAVNEQIAAWREQLATATAEDLSRKARLEKDLKEFAEHHKDEFAKARSRKLNHGVVGFRKSSELATIAKTKWEQVVALLQKAGLTNYINTKTTVNKEVVKAAGLPDSTLELYGMKLEDKDVFYYETANVTAHSTD